METNDSENSNATGSPWRVKKKEKKQRLIEKLAKCRLGQQRKREQMKQSMQEAALRDITDQGQPKASTPQKSPEVSLRKVNDSVDADPNRKVQELKEALTECQAEISKMRAKNEEMTEEVERLKKALIDKQERVRQLRDVMARLRFGQISTAAG
ncbi:unnamed protein product [Bursaphelenchus xylophilus]|uniref:(pine wood nematode) hypothetical protein n=1 Tax=Bursaphelenchus xylophilus TaxID=6326 RepID=A0A1I7RLN8_BURXY|nr:unnamed protein product [Bursaphelenchus xylophilus]CAG9082768.1 unnamed protein product [Bursaphelenchus xylophilus]